jgi:hypothetical protein
MTGQFVIERPCPSNAHLWSEYAKSVLPVAVFVELSEVTYPGNICQGKQWKADLSKPAIGKDGTDFGRLTSASGAWPSVCEHMGHFIE